MCTYIPVDFLKLTDPATGKVITAQVFKSIDIYQGSYVKNAPEISCLSMESNFIPTGSFFLLQSSIQFLVQFLHPQL